MTETTSSTSSLVPGYKPLTSESRVEDFDIPLAISLGGSLVKVPRPLRRKDVHYLLDAKGAPVRAAWIHKGLGHLLNYHRLEANSNGRLGCLYRALTEVEDAVSSLVKNEVLKDKHGPGFMSFVQSNENVPVDAIVLSERSWKELVKHNPRWEQTGKVSITRYPNLGPETTVLLRIIVNKEPDLFASTSSNSLLRLAHGEGLAALLDELEATNQGEPLGVFDAVYLHPDVLKGKLEGDGDGDLVFGLAYGKGKPRFQGIDMVRRPKPIDELVDDHGRSIVDILLKKSRRTERISLEQWLPDLFDNLPIAQATYAIHLKVRNRLARHKNSDHPMHDTWTEVAPWGLKRMEFVFDIRKGDWTREEIQAMMDELKEMGWEIKALQEEGDPFCCTITAPKVVNVPLFLEQFTDVQTYLDKVTGQNQGPTLKTLLPETE